MDGLVQLIRSPPVFSPLAPLAEIRKAQIVAGREQRAKTPSQANNYLDTLRALFKWAIAAELVKKDPTQGVENVARPKTEGFHPWTMDEVERFRARWPSGTRERWRSSCSPACVEAKRLAAQAAAMLAANESEASIPVRAENVRERWQKSQ